MEKEELNEFLNELIHDKNENGIILLLKTYPQLKENPELNVLLAQNNLLKPLDYLLAHGGIIQSDLIEQIFTDALLQNQKSNCTVFDPRINHSSNKIKATSCKTTPNQHRKRYGFFGALYSI